ncbi:hypothetical protein BV898_18151 [Hypsibius exemplaris]|uniref:Uncharacterized protein n=1 Tax=Hypsibius exemplaris TaxID=2072580 RepID=A0A9X6NIB9_HYPEX|nr:hypothetical protein BV898_18151 [Hypsibius exemplaris]
MQRLEAASRHGSIFPAAVCKNVNPASKPDLLANYNQFLYYSSIQFFHADKPSSAVLLKTLGGKLTDKDTIETVKAMAEIVIVMARGAAVAGGVGLQLPRRHMKEISSLALSVKLAPPKMERMNFSVNRLECCRSQNRLRASCQSRRGKRYRLPCRLL